MKHVNAVLIAFWRELPGDSPLWKEIPVNDAAHLTGFHDIFAEWLAKRKLTLRRAKGAIKGEIVLRTPTWDSDGGVKPDAKALAPNHKITTEFLDRTHGARPRHLVAINPEGGAPISKTFESVISTACASGLPQGTAAIGAFTTT